VNLAASRLARRLILLAAVAWLAAPALAGDPKKVDALLKTRGFEGTIVLDAGIKADPALAADSLAEGRTWLDKNAADAAAELKQDPLVFKEGGRTFERKYSVRSIVADRYASVLRDDYMDTHGAHPNSDVNTILWDRTARKRISIRPFFTETADNGLTMTAILRAVIAALRTEKKKRNASDTATTEWFKGLEPKLLKIGAVALAPSSDLAKSSGLLFYYPPYAVGPYAEGQYAAFVPWEVLKPHLSPDGAAIFGGARPKGDDDAAP
jgi:Protein of unknown function (DUF3298)